MERLRKSRKALRSMCTKLVNQVKTQLAADEICPADWAKIEANLVAVTNRLSSLHDLDTQIYEVMLDEDVPDEGLEQEVVGAGEYEVSVNEVQALYEARKSKYSKNEDSASLVSAQTSLSVGGGANNRYDLPKIEWVKFGGDVKDWIRFWSQFESVHEDGNLKPTQKYHYLVQATIPGSRAREIVDSFPPTKESYPKAIDSLKSRFGREDLLVEYYQRELLKLVVQNIVQKGKVPLSQVYDKIETQINNLETLGVTKDKSAGLLYPLVESCLNEELLRVWQRTPEYRAESATDKRLDKLMEFLRCEVEGEMKVAAAGSGFGLKEELKSRKKKEESVEEKIPTAASLVDASANIKSKQWGSAKGSCIFCEKAHASERCLTARSMSLEQRTEKVKESGVCFACLNGKHRIAYCRAKIKCIACEGRHLPILCRKLDAQKGTRSLEPIRDAAIGVLANSSGTVLLQTLMVQLKGKHASRLARALIDTGSQRSYVLSGLATALGLVPKRKERMAHAVFGGSVSSQIEHGCYALKLTDLSGKYAYQIDVLDQVQICSSIPTVANGPWVQELKARRIDVSDQPGPVEVLLGADFCGQILTGNHVQLKSGLVAVETHLGWTVMGKVPKMEQVGVPTSSMLSTTIDAISKLWKLDVLGIEDPSTILTKSEEAEAVKQHFLDTVSINEEGRYEVHLPWLPDHLPLPTNYNLAKTRLNSAISKLNKTGYFDKYDHIFKEWLEEGIIEPVPLDQLEIQGHYMPHRPVFRESLTTPIRPVFDASARQTNSPSLNQCLSKGLNLLELIPSLMLKFRLERFGVVSDIRKAFLQISLMEKDRNFVRFLWVDIGGNLIQLRHARVVFGVTSSPYLLGAVILYHLERLKQEERFPADVIEKLRTSFYCDNCISSLQTREELERFVEISSKIFMEGKFELRGWEFTDPTLPIGSPPTSVLGFLWDKRADTIRINTKSLQQLNLEGKVTKRFVTSVAHKLFDPIGFTAPASLLPKSLLQQVSKSKWDDEVPSNIKQAFVAWAIELPLLSQLAIPRWVGSENRQAEAWSLHTFVDASKEAFGCVCFLRIESNRGTLVQFIQAKSRVVPADCRHSIPRLELIAAVLGARLSSKILSDLVAGVLAYYWSDSTTVVAWIKREEEWASFVGNRVKEIRQLSNVDSWRHIPGQVNPADLPSRGCSIKKLLSSRWWEGPSWLGEDESDWPTGINDPTQEEEIAREKKKCKVISAVATVSRPTEMWYNVKFSKFSQNVRVLGWVKRFIKNCRSRSSRANKKRTLRSKRGNDWEYVCIRVGLAPKGQQIVNVEQLSSEEEEAAEWEILRLIQADHFNGVKDPKIQHIESFYDKNGLLRLKTRIMNREDDAYFRAPVILPGKCELVNKLIWQQHIVKHHLGVQGLLATLRERYWLLFGRNTVKAAIKNCVICQREAVKRLETPICPLPQRRVQDSQVFETTGVDLAGPLHLKDGQKVWVAIYTCAVYRAVHLEIVSSLSTDAFLMSLKRFVARRGRPTCIYSDNGTNFRGADNAFRKLDWGKIQEVSNLRRIRWIFSPPAGPWWGGWWERLIRMLKGILKKALGKSRVNLEELTTLLCDCEMLMNARPLTYISEDPKDLEPLTPAMFLQDLPGTGMTELDVMEAASLEARLRQRQKIRKGLKSRFRSEYLGQLVQKPSRGEARKLIVGDVVILGNDGTRRQDWPLARVEELIPGRDGHARVARLRTAAGQAVTRPLQRIYLLEGARDEKVMDRLRR